VDGDFASDPARGSIVQVHQGSSENALAQNRKVGENFLDLEA